MEKTSSTTVCWRSWWRRCGPIAPTATGRPWRSLEPHTERIRAWLEDDGLTVVKVHSLLHPLGVEVPIRTLERFCAKHFGPRRGRGTTVRVVDGEPGEELQVDFGRMGLLFDSVTGPRRVCHALILTACLSRHL